MLESYLMDCVGMPLVDMMTLTPGMNLKMLTSSLFGDPMARAFLVPESENPNQFWETEGRCSTWESTERKPPRNPLKMDTLPEAESFDGKGALTNRSSYPSETFSLLKVVHAFKPFHQTDEFKFRLIWSSLKALRVKI